MTGEVLLASAGAIAVVMIATWIVSLVLRDASIVDPVWPFGFVVVAWVTRAVADGLPARQWLIVAMVTIWGLRLSIYLAWRKHGEPEDYRYQAMRRHWGDRFALVSLLTVFGLQGVLMWIVSLPAQLGQVRDTPDLGVLAFVGVAVWLVGFAFESIGDAQLARFKADPASKGQVTCPLHAGGRLGAVRRRSTRSRSRRATHDADEREHAEVGRVAHLAELGRQRDDPHQHALQPEDGEQADERRTGPPRIAWYR